MSNEIESAYQYCESVTKTHAKSFYFAAKFLPKLKRRAVYPIYAFCRHVDDEIDEIGEGGDESAAVRAVEKWKRQLEEVFENKIQKTNDTNEDRKPKTKGQNLVFTAWKDLLKTYKIPKNLPLELMQGVLMDTQIKRYETFDELYVYCYRVASTVGLMSSEILGYSDKIALRYAEAMGVAMQLTNILRDVKEDAAMNRIYLPQEDLRKFEVSEAQIFSGDANENFVELMKFQIARARDFYRQGEQGIALLEKDSRFTVLLAARIYSRILDEIERQNYDVFARRASTTFSQKIFSLPKIWREAGSFKFQTSNSASDDTT
ncbi:MAG: Phytoene synthase [uncultured Pyrinomonadaceae bacterium]|uniref:Phytoene synthase n=1 Tax=uncultured Pyrinomonadaceae bacterium TaxID=2283094 RepID=A0A6J4N836_9BACT|nr:MAG: Phytoene synthase [uncultured Pyrinomonadaceae bacterium]